GDLRQSPHHEHPESHHRTRVAGAHHGIDLAALHQFEADLHRRIFYTQRGARRLAHWHDLRSGGDGKSRRVLLLGQLALDRLFVAHQNYFDTVILVREHRPFDNHLRSSITTHRVDGDFRHMSWDCLTLLDLEHGAA